MKVLRGGCASKHESSFSMSCPCGADDYVLLLLRSEGEFWIDGIEYQLKPGWAVLISPKIPYRYSNSKGSYSDDWLHFMPEKGERIPERLVCNVPFALEDFETCSILMRLLLWENAYTSAEYAAENINALFTVLLSHLTFGWLALENIESSNPYLNKFKSLRLNMAASLKEKHSISRYAAELSISTSHFQHLYTQFFGISFQKDLIRMRITYAEVLLQATDLSLETIAENCGYTNCVHFFRQFKQIKGITPAKYRSMLHSAETY